MKILSRDTRNEGEMMVIRYVLHGASGETKRSDLVDIFKCDEKVSI